MTKHCSVLKADGPKRKQRGPIGEQVGGVAVGLDYRTDNYRLIYWAQEDTKACFIAFIVEGVSLCSKDRDGQQPQIRL